MRPRIWLLFAVFWVCFAAGCSNERAATVHGIVRVDGKPCADLEVWFEGRVYPEASQREKELQAEGYPRDAAPTVYKYKTMTGPDGSYCLRNMKPGVEYYFGALRKDIVAVSDRNRPFKVEPGSQELDIDVFTTTAARAP
jgi:hypothetical protein